ncbi:MAG: RnfABCDGE type electron transport complex subunit D [Candidatus Methylumidiphilus sp.]
MSPPILSAPFTRAEQPVRGIMQAVILALAPGTAWGVVLFGWPALFLFMVTVVSALAFEMFSLKLSGKPVRATLSDSSAMLTGWLIALTLPPWAPWWTGVLGAFIGIVVGKQVFGGLGQNLFNPAMLARVALLVSFPLELTSWVNPTPLFSSAAPSFEAAWAITFHGQLPADGISGATLLGWVKTEFSQGRLLAESLPSGHWNFFASLFGWTGGSLGETSALFYAIGGAWLLKQKIITWHIPLSMLATVALLASVFTLLDGARYPGPLFHLTSGALMLGAFFIATDYVTSPNSPTGQLIFGAGCGLLVYVIRTWGGYPEGVAFAVLLMNSLTPIIDHYVRPRIYGRDLKGRPLELPEVRK